MTSTPIGKTIRETYQFDASVTGVTGSGNLFVNGVSGAAVTVGSFANQQVIVTVATTGLAQGDIAQARGTFSVTTANGTTTYAWEGRERLMCLAAANLPVVDTSGNAHADTRLWRGTQPLTLTSTGQVRSSIILSTGTVQATATNSTSVQINPSQSPTNHEAFIGRLIVFSKRGAQPIPALVINGGDLEVFSSSVTLDRAVTVDTSWAWTIYDLSTIVSRATDSNGAALATAAAVAAVQTAVDAIEGGLTPQQSEKLDDIHTNMQGRGA
jgi:hypothetical protein